MQAGRGSKATLPRSPRRDAVANKERLLEAALHAIGRDGLAVPVSVIAAEAGVGVATFYRSFPDRHALMVALEHRAYDKLIEILRSITARRMEGLDAVREFLVASVAIGAELILPLHGAPVLIDEQAVAKRQMIDALIEAFLDQGRASGAVKQEVNATDVIVCSALLTQPLRQSPDWRRSATRHLALFVSGIASEGVLPLPPVRQRDIESTFRDRAAGAGRSRGQSR
ncbi:TetR/AcrR family transcriptional regulator [Microbacterium enclense]|nr:TetR/AcrR family transcriptional regulator [Microbacterium enclense]